MKKTFASASKKIKTKKNASKLAEKMQNFIKRKISEQGKINKENEKPTIQTIDETIDKLLSNSSRFLSWNNLDLKNIMHFPTNIEINDEYINVQI